MFKKFSISKWNHWNNVKMILKHNAKEKKMDTEKRENELMKEDTYKYDNPRDLLKFIMDVATTNIDLTDNEKWKNEWRFVAVTIDEFLNG